MSNFRRNYQDSGTYFFTATLKNRNTSTLTDHFNFLKIAVLRVKQTRPFLINAWVVLPEHLHMIWTLPKNDSAYSLRWRSIKTLFCKQFGKPDKGNTRIWQPRFWEHTIRSEKDFNAHVDYIHFNPLKHGYVNRVVDWPYSSFHHYVRKGVYGSSWSSNIEVDEKMKFGK